MAQRIVRVCVVGDELVAGVGDPKGLGWLGRVAARTVTDPPVQLVPLPAPGETTAALAERWEGEVSRRLSPATDDHLVIGLGRADLDTDVSTARSRLNVANILDAAERLRLRTLVVGPPPSAHHDPERLGELSAAYADVATRRGVRYVETFAPLVAHEQWLADLASGDGRLPGQAGYGLLAWLVLHGGWHRWLGLPEDDTY